jgi:NADH:ubiquinone oxidoreductase subunit K
MTVCHCHLRRRNVSLPVTSSQSGGLMTKLYIFFVVTVGASGSAPLQLAHIYFFYKLKKKDTIESDVFLDATYNDTL